MARLHFSPHVGALRSFSPFPHVCIKAPFVPATVFSPFTRACTRPSLQHSSFPYHLNHPSCLAPAAAAIHVTAPLSFAACQSVPLRAAFLGRRAFCAAYGWKWRAMALFGVFFNGFKASTLQATISGGWHAIVFSSDLKDAVCLWAAIKCKQASAFTAQRSISSLRICPASPTPPSSTTVLNMQYCR